MKFSTKQINIFGGCMQLKIPFDQGQAIGALQKEANAGKYLDVEIKVHREKRSLNANAYAWRLIHEIAKKLPLHTDEDVYKEAIRKAGVKAYVALDDSTFERFSREWSKRGIGCFVERLRELRGLNNVYTVSVYYGSSEYNTQEMSRFIEYLVEEAKDLGCDVMSAADQQLLLDKWSNEHG